MPEKTRVAVVFGGGSTEHAVSSVGAADLLDALDTDDLVADVRQALDAVVA